VAPRMFEALRRGPAVASEAGEKDGWEDMQWVRNRTVVVFGDSVARENVAYFCEVCSSSLITKLFTNAHAADRRETGSDHMGPSVRSFPETDTNATATRIAPLHFGHHDVCDTKRPRRGSRVGEGLETQAGAGGRGSCASCTCVLCGGVGVVARAAVSIWVS
jgi:hypothetical protein